MSDWEEEFEAKPVASSRPKMAWDDEDADDDNEVKEDWDESGSDFDEEVPKKSETKQEEPKHAPPPKKGLTLKQKIAEKEAALKEQKKKKMALANRFLEGETEEERFERAQKEAGIEKKEFEAPVEDATKKAPAKPVESCKPRTRADFEEFKKLLIDLILEKSGNPAYPSFLEQLARDVSAPMKDMDVRKAASSLTALANDKVRQNKEALKSSKKTKGKAQPAAAAAAKPAASSREYSTTYDDFDDFM